MGQALPTTVWWGFYEHCTGYAEAKTLRYLREYEPENQVLRSNELRLNASRTSKRRVSGCHGTSLSGNELITLTLPKSGVARSQHRCTQVNR